jgi:hypothetical protein
MKTIFIILSGVLAFGTSLQATTSYNLDFNTQSNSAGLVYDGNYAISPYSGTVNGTTLALYCDDFNDNINFGQQNVTVYTTALTATGATLDDDTRYGVNNAPGSTYSAGTQLYDEIAWLTTQMMAQSGTNATANDKAIQEAIWTLTNDSTGAEGSSPHNENTELSGTALTSATDSTAQGYLNWIAEANNAVSNGLGTESGYSTLVPGDWYIVTAVGSAGCTIGSNGSTGCTPGTSGSGNVTQEFLAYYNGNLPVSTVSSVTTPEPGSLLLMVSGLLFSSFVARRRLRLANQSTAREGEPS